MCDHVAEVMSEQDQEKPSFADFKYEWTITAEPTEEVIENDNYIPYLQDHRWSRFDVRGPVTPSAWEAAQEAAWEAFIETLADELTQYDMSDFEFEEHEREEN